MPPRQQAKRAEIHIYSGLALSQPRHDFEDDIEARFADEIEVTGGGQGLGGWNIDLRLLDEEADVHRFATKLVKFLQKCSLPHDTYLNVFMNDWIEGNTPVRIEVFGGTCPP